MNTPNTVELIGYYGSDETIALSAWTSTSRELSDEKRNRIPQLIKMLWSESHHTPFEKCIVQFLVNTDIASHIHLLKHRMSSINSESARYKELKDDKYYLPEDWAGIEMKTPDPLMFNLKWLEMLEEHTLIGNKLYHDCLTELEPILGRKRAKESARFFKTYNSQIQADVSFNLRSFHNFLTLRNSEHAQKEIREVAQGMLKAVAEIPGNPFKHTLEAWGFNDYISPPRTYDSPKG